MSDLQSIAQGISKITQNHSDAGIRELGKCTLQLVAECQNLRAEIEWLKADLKRQTGAGEELM